MKKEILNFFVKLLDRIANIYWWTRYSLYREQYDLDSQFRFNGKHILLYGQGNIVAGPKSYVGELSTLQAAKGFKITIGAECKISHNVRVYTQTAIADEDFSIGDLKQKCGDVKFGDHCWVGANVFINPGVTIGKNSVVGANSVVTKDIPPFEIWGGVPAKFIRSKSCMVREGDGASKK